MSKVIGLIGLGVMGENIAKNFIDRGVQVHAFNNSEKKLKELVLMIILIFFILMQLQFNVFMHYIELLSFG